MTERHDREQTFCQRRVVGHARRLFFFRCRAWLAPLLGTVFAVLAVEACGDEVASTPAGARPVEIRVRWSLEALPGAEVSIHEALPDDVEGTVAVAAAGETLSLGPEIRDDTLHANYDEPVRFVVMIRNTTDEPLRFWAPPHLALPIDVEPQLVIRCLCTGVQYEAPAGGSWRRVLSYGLSRRSSVREPLSITHVLVAGELPTP